MSLADWQSKGWLHPHTPSAEEIRDLLSLADRDLVDCHSAGLSADWQFNIAYNALLQSAVAALAAEGYRPAGGAHHYRALQSLALTIGLEKPRVRQVDAFRKKRNLAGYERVGAISQREVSEMVELARLIRRDTEAWIRQFHPSLL